MKLPLFTVTISESKRVEAVNAIRDLIGFYIAYLIISTVQLGATVDYAILLTNSYVENRRDYLKKDALLKTISSVTLSEIVNN